MAKRMSTGIRDISEGLKENLQCSVCLGQYVNPKILPCHHSFCLECLEHLPRNHSNGKQFIKCPNCYNKTKLPRNGVADLPNDFRINSLLDLQVKESHVSYCSIHSDEELKVYCNTCETVICLECTVTAEHNKHDFKLISKCYTKQIQEMKAGLDSVCRKLAQFQNAVFELEKTEYSISVQKDHLQGKIQDHTENMIACIRESEAALLNQLSAIVKRKKIYISAQKKKAKESIVQLRQCQEETVEVLESNKQNNFVNVLTRKKEIMTRIHMATNCYPNTFVPVEKANIVFTKFNTVEFNVAGGSHIGELKANEFDTLSLSKRSRSYLANTPVTNTLTLISDDNHPLDISPIPITCIAVTPPNASITSCVECEVKKVEHTYKLSFVPRLRGEYKLYFLVGGLQVWNDPIIFNIIPTPEMRTKPMYSICSTLAGPIGVAVADNGDLAIAEFTGNRVLLYKEQLNKLVIKANSGSMKGQVFEPRGVAFSKTGQILVTDSHRLQLLPSSSPTSRVQCVGTITAGSSSTQFNNPVSVAVNYSTGDVFVADCGNNRIQVFSSSLVHSRTINRYGLLTGLLNKPCALTVDENGYLYVCLQNDTCVYKLSPEGWLKTRIELKQDELPRCITLAKTHLSVAVHDCFVYVGNYKSILIFDIMGKYRSCIQNLNSEAFGLDIDQYGDLYVTDFENKTIVVL